MTRRPPRSTRTDTLFPYTTRFRSRPATSTSAPAAATDGTAGDLRTFNETLLKSAIKAAYDAGGKPNKIFLGSGNKQLFSSFSGRANAREIVGNEDKILASARSEERREGKECVSTCRSRGSPDHSKKKDHK